MNLICQLSGIRYFQEKLLIQSTVQTEVKKTEQNTADYSVQIEHFVRNRISSDSKSISFDSTADVLRTKYKLPFHFNQKHFVDKILDCIAALSRNVETISFAKNNIHSLYPFSQLWYKLPSIKNVSFEDNSIASLKDLDYIVKIQTMEDLILSGNPVTRIADYFKTLKSKFPVLRYLDRREVFRRTTGLSPTRTSSHLTPRAFFGSVGNFFDTVETSSFVEAVFSKFFNLFDTDRSQLMSLYSTDAVFSINSVKYDPRITHKLTPKRPGWRIGFFDSKDLFSNAANCTKISSAEIELFFQQIPKTQHDLSKMHFDAWQSLGSSLPIMNVFAT